ncbi:major facilitator superfamily domain-containing protein [Aspergillus cavernicola]|uniref:Major facilitator superfamily domain-containing protein n=1 Tax=Aspergillus cavernicola TaxID=176166 RepID=A0ABR4J2Y8_9EURO
MQSTRNNPPWRLRYRSSTVFIIATVWISSFTDYFLYAMVVPILPTALVERANIPYEDREYWVSVLLMCEAATAFICCPIFGYIVDIAPTRRLPYVLGLIFLGASMGLLAAARSTTMFVIARLLQGGATAMVAVAGLALLTDSVPLDNLGQTIGYQGSAIALGFLLGPLLGGIVYDAAGYQAVFGMAFALVGVDLLMRVAVVEKKVAARWIEIDPSLSSIHFTAVRQNSGYQTFAETRPADIESVHDHNHCHELGSDCGHDQPTLFQIAKQPRVVISSFGLLVQGLLFSAFDATIPIFVETTFKWTPLGAGLAFLPSALTALLEPLFGYIADKHGTRPPAFISFLLLPIPLCCLSLVTTNSPAHITLLLLLLTLTGLLINLATPALFVETQDVLDSLNLQPRPRPRPNQPQNTNETPNPPNPNKLGKSNGIAQAFGVQTMAQFLGMFLGSLWGGFVEWRFGWRVMVFSLAGLCFGTCWGMLMLGKGSSSSSSSSSSGWRGKKSKGSEVVGGGNGVEEGRERERLLGLEGE